MNKSDLIYRITTRANDELLAYYKEALVADVVNTALDHIADGLAAHGRLEIRGFGAFSVRTYEGDRYIRNPATGVAGYAKRLPRVRFKASEGLRKGVDVYGRKAPDVR
jgi:integration host factor subunit beta